MSEEEIVIDGKVLKDMKVAELKKACKIRNLPLGGNKSTLIKRLKAAVELEDLKKSALNSDGAVQPNSNIADNSAENDFVKQYLENQRKMLQKQQHRFSSASEAESEDDAPKRKHPGSLSSPLPEIKSPASEESVPVENVFKEDVDVKENNTLDSQNSEVSEREKEPETHVNNETDSSQIHSSDNDNNAENTPENEMNEEKAPMPESSPNDAETDNGTASTLDSGISTSQSFNDKQSLAESSADNDQLQTDKSTSVTEKTEQSPEKDNPELSESTTKSKAQDEEQTAEQNQQKPDDIPLSAADSIKPDYGDSCIESSQASKSELEEMDTAVVSVQSTQNENIGAENVKNETEVVEMEKPADNAPSESTKEVEDLTEKQKEPEDTVMSSQDDHKDVEGVPVISMETDVLMEEVEELDYDEADLDKPENHNGDPNQSKEDNSSKKKRKQHREKNEKLTEDSPEPKKQRKLKRSIKSDSSEKTEKIEPSKSTEPLSSSPSDDTKPQVADEQEKNAEKTTKRRISIKKNPIKRSSAPEQPREKKRKWGKATSSDSSHINISTDYLKNIIDIKEGAIDEAVVDLETSKDIDEPEKDDSEEEGEIVEEVVVEEEVREEHVESMDEDGNRQDSRRVVSSDKAEEKPSPDEKSAKRERKSSRSEPTSKREVTIKKPSGDGPRDVSPARMPTSCVLHVSNLVRPFALSQLKQLLSESGEFLPDSFWINNIKSHCFVTYESTEVAAKTRNALHRLQWPTSSPKNLIVEFSTEEEVEWNKREQPLQPLKPKKKKAEPEKMKDGERVRSSRKDVANVDVERRDRREKEATQVLQRKESSRHERDATRRDRDRERSAERSRRHEDRSRDRGRERRRDEERESRNRRPSLREWDMHKLDQDEEMRKQQREEKRREERAASSERRKKRKEEASKPPPEPPKLLDDLFRKTEATPCVYWLPLTEEQVFERDKERERRRNERAKLRREDEIEEETKREERAKRDEKPLRRDESRDDERRRDDRRREERERVEARRRESDRGRNEAGDYRSRTESRRRDERSGQKEADNSNVRSRSDRLNASRPARRRTASSSSSSSDSSGSDSSESSSASSSSSESEDESPRKRK